jgi:hypothetical protein
MLLMVLVMLSVMLEQQQTVCQVLMQLVGVRASRAPAAACRRLHQGQQLLLRPAAPKVLLLAAQHGSQVGSRTPRLHPAVQEQQQ